MANLAGKSITFAYDPASASDQAIINNAVESYQTRLPAYLIRVKSALKIEGVTATTGGTSPMGASQLLTVTVKAPWYSHDSDYQVTSGDFYALGLNPSGITAKAFEARTQQHDLRNATDKAINAYSAEMFHQIALAWWAEKYAFNDFIGSLNKVVHYQLPSHTLAGSPLTVRYFFGMARSASYTGRVMDAKEDLLMAVHASTDPEQTRRFAVAAGYVGSYLEAGIFEQAFLMEPGHAMSTITALKAANEKGVPIYSIDQRNAAALNQIQTDPEDVQTMRSAVAAGLRVTTAQRDISVDNFTGLGYILENPKTGAAAYIISGGRNGGNSPAGQTSYPLPQFPAIPVLGFMAGSALRGAGASLIAEGGVVTGIALPEIAAGAAGAAVGAGAAAGVAAAVAILLAVIIILILLTAVIQAVDEKYPRTNRRFRHYTNAASKILASQVIVQTEGGTFRDGVYVADADDEKRRGIGCPPNSLDVATRFQIPRPDKIDPSRVTGWIEITITRENYYLIDAGVNSTSQTENIILGPLMPTLHPADGHPTRGLFIGPYAFALEVTGVCL